MRYDAAVVGAGPAGITCALGLAERGGRVLLLEQSDRVGGALHVSGGHLSAGGTKRQRDRGIEDSASVEVGFQDVNLPRKRVREPLATEIVERGTDR